MNDTIVVVTGGFDPIHSGHIAYIKAAREHGRVIVGLNSDAWLKRKKGSEFMSFTERRSIVENLKDVTAVVAFNDDDNSAVDAILQVKTLFPKNKIIFANGGDRNSTNIPEMTHFTNDPLVEFVFGVGGENKMNSSSWILSEWKHPSETRPWGKFMTYYDSTQAKVKRLILAPGKSISMQFHDHRSEFWFVENGTGEIFTLQGDRELSLGLLSKHYSHHVKVAEWHRLENVGSEDLCIIEIQYGEYCCETDITRRVLTL